MKAFLAAALCAFALLSHSAFADEHSRRSRSVSPSSQVKGAHPKPSSLAPRAGSKRHVYGAPIQSPILTRRHPSKPAAQQGQPSHQQSEQAAPVR